MQTPLVKLLLLATHSYTLSRGWGIYKWFSNILIFQISPNLTHTISLYEIEVPNPVHKVEEAKSSWEEYSGVGINFGHMNMHPVFTPCPWATVIKAAKKTRAVFPIQALVCIIIIIMIGCDVIHLEQRCPWSDVRHAWFLQERNTELFCTLEYWLGLGKRIMEEQLILLYCSINSLLYQLINYYYTVELKFWHFLK